MHINDFDNNIRHKKSRKPEYPPPLIDISYRYVNMDDINVIEQVSTNPNSNLPVLTDDSYDNVIEQWNVTNDDVYQPYDDIGNIIDPTIDNDIIGNTTIVDNNTNGNSTNAD